MIIGITGVAGSGKDTVADYLASKYGFIKVSFASILKEMLAIAGLPEPSDRDDKEKPVKCFNFTWREAAQTLGTEWGRALDENIWVKLTMAKLDLTKNYVISDVRFDNEAEVIAHYGGIIVQLTGRYVELGGNSEHSSEKGIRGNLIDYHIENSGHIDYLYEQIDYTVKEEFDNAFI